MSLRACDCYCHVTMIATFPPKFASDFCNACNCRLINEKAIAMTDFEKRLANLESYCQPIQDAITNQPHKYNEIILNLLERLDALEKNAKSESIKKSIVITI